METEIDSIELHGPLGLMMRLKPVIGRWCAFYTEDQVMKNELITALLRGILEETAVEKARLATIRANIEAKENG